MLPGLTEWEEQVHRLRMLPPGPLPVRPANSAPGGGGWEEGRHRVKFKKTPDPDCPPQPDLWGSAVSWMRCRRCEWKSCRKP